MSRTSASASTTPMGLLARRIDRLSERRFALADEAGPVRMAAAAVAVAAGGGAMARLALSPRRHSLYRRPDAMGAHRQKTDDQRGQA